MSEDATTGVQNQDPAAGGQVDDQGTKQAGSAEAQAAAAAAEETTTVPLAALKKLREELQTVKEQNTLYQTQLGLARNMPAQPAAQPQTAAQPDQEDFFADMDDDDVMTVADAKKIMKNLPKGGGSEIEQVRGELTKIQLYQQDPDYENTIRNYLPEVVNSNPAIVQTIQQSPNPLLCALTFAKMNPRYQSLNQQQGGAQAGETLLDQINRIIENAEKPGSASQVSGSGAISGASRFKDMTPAQIEEHKNKVIAGVS